MFVPTSANSICLPSLRYGLGTDEGPGMRATIHLQNIVDAGCVANVRLGLEMIDGVKAVQVDRERKVAEVLFEEPATALDLREQLLTMGYLAEGRASE